MIDQFQQHINKDLPFLKGAKLLLAISGGVDSVVLAELCHRSGLNIALAHCNYNLRGSESDEDEQFVRQLSKKLDVALYVESFDTKACLQQFRGSLQMAARKLRYDWFAFLLDTLNFDYVLTAHHADDNLETFLINLSRGTGIEGLNGIPEVNGRYVRPLLPFSREEIKAWAVDQNIKWRDDSSNSETKYLRNKFRHQIIPGLREIAPNLISNFNKTVNNLKGSSAILNNHITDLRNNIFITDGSEIRVAIADLLKLQPRKDYLFALFRDHGFTDADELEKILFADSGKHLLSAGYELLKDRDQLIMKAIQAQEVVTEHFIFNEDTREIEDPLKLSFAEVDSISDNGENTIFVDAAKLRYPLILRKWQEGDYFYPFGMNGKKKIAKFYKDEKYSLFDKEEQWLLCSENEIVWVVGKRADDRFRVDEDTRSIIKIELTQQI